MEERSAKYFADASLNASLCVSRAPFPPPSSCPSVVEDSGFCGAALVNARMANPAEWSSLATSCLLVS